MTGLMPVADGAVLVVDDEEPVRRSVARQLERMGYIVRTAANAGEADVELAAQSIGLVLCDINMPGESGMSLAGRIRVAYPDVSVVMVTAVDDAAVAAQALDDGAYGYIIKPFEHNELVIGVAGALRRRTLEIENRNHREHLESLVDSRTEELRRSHEELIGRLMSAADYRDPETATHLQRMSRYSALLTGLMGGDNEERERMRLAAPMHDIGKIGIPDEILCKTGPFTVEDRKVMMAHPEIGYRILVDSGAPLIQLAADIAYTHHEWFDGTGYPRRLQGDAIPVAGRIVAIADVYDALRTQRRYKPAMSVEDTLSTMRAERGRHFDPDLLDAFIVANPEVEAIREMYSDGRTEVG